MALHRPGSYDLPVPIGSERITPVSEDTENYQQVDDETQEPRTSALTILLAVLAAPVAGIVMGN